MKRTQNIKIHFQLDSHSRDFSILFHLPCLSISQAENNGSAKFCEAGAANRSTAKTDSWLYAFWQVLSQNSRGISRHHIGLNIVSDIDVFVLKGDVKLQPNIGLNISNVLVDYLYGSGCVMCMAIGLLYNNIHWRTWLELVIKIILVIVIVSFCSITLVIISF